jgi:elongation factor G
MGELHLDIIKQRLLTEFKVDAYLGKMSITYRETILSPVEHSYTHQITTIQGQPTGAYVTLNFELHPKLDGTEDLGVAGTDPVDITFAADEGKGTGDADVIEMDNMRSIRCDFDEGVQTAIEDGILRSAARGSLLGFPLTEARVHIRSVYIAGSGANANPLSGATPSPVFTSGQFAITCSKAMFEAVRMASPAVLEPFMQTQVSCPDSYIGGVLNDLVSRRRATVRSVDKRGVEAEEESSVPLPSVIFAEVPLTELRDYSSGLRGSTQGTAGFSMEFMDFRVAPSNVVMQLQQQPIF